MGYTNLKRWKTCSVILCSGGGLKRPVQVELYQRLRDLDYAQVDERIAVMLNAVLQLEIVKEASLLRKAWRKRVCYGNSDHGCV